MNKRSDFIFSTNPEPHRSRTKQILKQHPQVRQLIGKNPLSFIIIVCLVTMQISLAGLLAEQAWWAILLLLILLELL
jgi:sphingolipid 4-desaturase/C4-monooxygenase